MRTRLILIVLILVVIPTAILSLVASRSIEARELVLRDQLEASAAKAVQSVADRFARRLDDDLERIESAMAEHLSRGGKYADIRMAAVRLCSSRRTIKSIYLFMNPWGFLYPQDIDADVGSRSGLRPGWDYVPQTALSYDYAGDIDSASVDGLTRLVSVLRREVARHGSRGGSIRFFIDGTLYNFSLLPHKKGLYAGYEVDAAAFSTTLQEIIDSTSVSGFILRAEGMGKLGASHVVIGDSFSLPEQLPSHDLWRLEYTDVGGSGSGYVQVRSSEPVLAAGHLIPLYEKIRIEAIIVNDDATAQSEALRVRLYAWGIVLLAAGICFGVGFVILETTQEIRKARAKSDFVVGVSHDLRTPIASMKVLAESLYLDRVESEDKRKLFLGTITRECDRLSQLIERVLFLVRFGQNALVYRFQEVNIEELIKSVVEGFDARSRDQSVEVVMGPDLPRVNADDAALTQVVLNLLDNAVKYGSKTNQCELQRVHIDVRVVERASARWCRRRRWLAISVRDHGVGIDPKEWKKIFRPFYRSPGARDDNVSGVGLGLALCKHVMKAHGGLIEVESVPGEGSTFSVFIPVKLGTGD